jgi:hypothetical protein
VEPPVPTGLAKLTAAQRALVQFLRIEEDLVAAGRDLFRALPATPKGGHLRRRRTVADLRALADDKRTQRERAEAARARKAAERAEGDRQRRLTKLAPDLEAAWKKLETLVESRAYDEAVKLAVDLRDLATRDAEAVAFAKRFETLRKRYLRRRGFFDQWKRT